MYEPTTVGTDIWIRKLSRRRDIATVTLHMLEQGDEHQYFYIKYCVIMATVWKLLPTVIMVHPKEAKQTNNVTPE